MIPTQGKRDWNPPNIDHDVQPNQWEAGLCECFSNCNDLVCAWFFPYCFYGDLADRLDKNGCCCPCCVYAGSEMAALVDLRKRVR